ncbi:MAG: DUF5691 domain-containing protein [Zoogloeaceae bacterium]|jgi:hypothetical protein|nr:DUF5691 domain-containing protein [Zoogloeaceae bacterium]
MSQESGIQESERGKDFLRQFAVLRDNWLVGGRAAATLAPEDWRVFLAKADAEEGERRLLALAGQVWDLALRPMLPKDARGRKDLPALALPTLPETLRSLFRGALVWGRSHAREKLVLRLIEQRGFSAHPLDWFPTTDDAPDLYTPWLDWRSGPADAADGNFPADAQEADQLTEETWDLFYPAQRRLLLKNMRRSRKSSDPGQTPQGENCRPQRCRPQDRARELIAACAGRESAENRLALIAVLETGLSEEDVPYLQSLANDRSGKVKALAARFLARLRHRKEGESDPDLAEFADFFEFSRKGIFGRARVVVAKSVKSQAQATRRVQLFERISLLEFAFALGLREDELIDGWQFGQGDQKDKKGQQWPVDPLFAQMVVTSAADEEVIRFAERLLAQEEMHPALLTLLPRLDRDRQQKVMTRILAHPGASSVVDANAPIWQLTKIEYGNLAGPKEILASPVYQSLKAELAKETTDALATLALSALNALAVVASAEAARAVLDDIVESCQIFRAHPSLAFLRLNAELAAEGI